MSTTASSSSRSLYDLTQIPALDEQVAAAVLYPQEFSIAILNIQQTNLPRLLENPDFRSSICPWILNREICPLYRCPYAGSIAELYANNIYRNPTYKTKECKYREFCHHGARCWYGHPGDLLRTVRTNGAYIETTGWYILR